MSWRLLIHCGIQKSLKSQTRLDYSYLFSIYKKPFQVQKPNKKKYTISSFKRGRFSRPLFTKEHFGQTERFPNQQTDGPEDPFQLLLERPPTPDGQEDNLRTEHGRNKLQPVLLRSLAPRVARRLSIHQKGLGNRPEKTIKGTKGLLASKQHGGF